LYYYNLWTDNIIK